MRSKDVGTTVGFISDRLKAHVLSDPKTKQIPNARMTCPMQCWRVVFETS